MKNRVFAFAAAFATVGFGVSSAATTYDVSTADELTNAVTVAASGDTIRLAPGTYDLTGCYECWIDPVGMLLFFR